MYSLIFAHHLIKYLEQSQFIEVLLVRKQENVMVTEKLLYTTKYGCFS